MARDLNKARNDSVATNGDRTEVTGEPRGRSPGELAGELATDTYNIVVALAILSLSYWLLFRGLPVELFTLGLAAVVLAAVNGLVAVRRWYR
ncbi:hypothetical protein NGM10_08000 [Halorussus salilacus]|uniref:hypothetical protein n=1 Tax=Halorussus salilacus TaxID=2953750 RepID=UPI00209E56CC|nr:hypothetical protein [Halorussus salilacus]USZ66687.1 hypothetical protein NGM10_08000 [Halorussus salilacus]